MPRKIKKTTKLGKFKSQLELEISKRLPRSTKYESETLLYFIPKKYKPDFIIKTRKGKIYLEVKGFFRYEDQRKMKAVKEANPGLDIRMYFPKDQKVHLSKMMNTEWCAKYGFPCYIGELPDKWF